MLRAAADKDILTFDYPDTSSGMPPSFWREARVSVCRLMREAHEDGLTLADHPEPLREWAIVQEVLAGRRELYGAEMPS